MNKRLTANLMLVLTALIWGFAFVAQSRASEHIGSFTFIGLRFVIGSVSLIPVILLFERKGLFDKKRLISTVKYGIITGCVLFVASSFQQFGVALMENDSKAGFITGMYTVLVPIYGIFLGKKTSANAWIGAILAVIGLYFVSVVGVEKLEFGDLICLIGAFFWALHIIVIDRFVDKVSPIMYSSVQFLTAGVLGILFTVVFELQTVSFTNILNAGIPILYAGLFSSGVAYTLQILGQKNSKPTEAAIIFSLESVFACVGCWWLLGHSMSALSMLGCVFVFAGIIISQLNFKKKI